MPSLKTLLRSLFQIRGIFTSAPLDPLFTMHDNHHINALAMVNNHLYAGTSHGLTYKVPHRVSGLPILL